MNINVGGKKESREERRIDGDGERGEKMREEETDAACRPFSRVFSFPPPPPPSRRSSRPLVPLAAPRPHFLPLLHRYSFRVWLSHTTAQGGGGGGGGKVSRAAASPRGESTFTRVFKFRARVCPECMIPASVALSSASSCVPRKGNVGVSASAAAAGATL